MEVLNNLAFGFSHALTLMNREWDSQLPDSLRPDATPAGHSQPV